MCKNAKKKIDQSEGNTHSGGLEIQGPMKKIRCFAVLATFALGFNLNAASIEWNNTGSDWATGTDWVGGTAPADSTTTDTAVFGSQGAGPINPVLATARSVGGISFLSGAYAYTIGGNTLTIGATGIGNASTNTQTFSNTLRISASQAWSTGAGGLTVLNGIVDLNATSAAGRTLTVSGAGDTTFSNTIQNSFAGSTGNLTYSGTGILTLTGTNTYTGTTILSSGTVRIGNNSAFGTSAITLSNTTLQAFNASRSIANNVSYTATTGATVSGTNDLTFTGTWTDNASRTLTNSISGGTLTLAGNVFLSDNNSTTNRRLTLTGAGNTVISGVVANNNFGNTVAAGITYSGSGSLTLSNANTYSGGTIISGGAVIANTDGALGTGNVSLTAGNVTLTLQNGATQNYIADTASLSYVTTDTINLNYTGTDTISMLTVDGVVQPIGLYGAGATNPDGAFTGPGFIQVTAIPEPSTAVLFGIACLLGAQRLRRKSR
jgi:autotransporter-associated beta strand protein